jgi:nucleoside-diphosphate-sugar epimerase
LTAALSGEPPHVHGDGQQSRDFTYVANVVEANVRAITAPDVAGQALNVACGNQISLLDLLDTIATVTGRPLQPVLGPARPGDVLHSAADIGQARKVLGYEPSVSLEDGLRATVDWLAASPLVNLPMG